MWCGLTDAMDVTDVMDVLDGSSRTKRVAPLQQLKIKRSDGLKKYQISRTD